MAATPPTIAPVAPSPTIAPVPAAAPPPSAPPPLSTLTEKASQLAGQISTQQQFEAGLASLGGATLPPQAKGQLWDTVQKTRVGQGLPPMTISAPGAPPGGAPVVGGAAPVPPAVTAALPASVTAAPNAAPSGTPQVATSANPVPPPPVSPAQKQVPGQEVPLEQAPPAPTATYQAPDLKTPTYNAPKYEPPKKGLLYAAAALALLFPGSQIGRAAGQFAQGLNTGAQQKYQRDTDTAKTQFDAEKQKDDVINQGALAQASANFSAAQRDDAYKATVTGVGNENQLRIYQARQLARQNGTNPDTGKPFQLPGALLKPPDPKGGYDALAQWHQARAAFYDHLGATNLAAGENKAADDAIKEADSARTQAAELQRTILTIQNANARTNATISAGYDRQAAEFRNGWAMLNAREADQYRDQAVRSNGEANKLWANLTTPVTDQYGQTKPPVVDPKSPLAQSITMAMNQMQKGQGRFDPQGYAQYVIDNTPSLKDNPIAAQVLQAKAQGLEFTMRSNGYQPVPFIAPPTPKQPPVSGLSFAQDALSHNVPLANIPKAMADNHYTPTEIAGAMKSLKVANPAAAPPVDAAHPDAPLLGIAQGVQHVVGAGGGPQDRDAAARAAGLTPGTPAWNNYMRTHAAQ